MAVDIYPDASYIRVTFSGTVSNGELEQAGREVARIKDALSVVPNRLADLSGSTHLDLNFQGVWAFAEDRRRRSFPNAFKTAIIAGDAAHYGFARMFQTLNDHPQITIAIFRDVESARMWLELPGIAAPAKAWAPNAIAP